MTRTQISIKLDTDLLERIDRLAESIGSTRTAIIEQAIKNDLPESERYYRSLENPVVRSVHAVLTQPHILEALAKLTRQEMTPEEFANITEKAPVQRERARERSQAKRQAGKGSD